MFGSGARSPGAADLTACDREPIHLLGTLQPHGFLLVLEEPDLRIVQASANVPDLPGCPAAGIRGTSLLTAFPQAAAALAPYLSEGQATEGAAYLTTLAMEGSEEAVSYDLAVHRVGDLIVLEF